MMQCKFLPFLSQSLMAHLTVKWENFTAKFKVDLIDIDKVYF